MLAAQAAAQSAAGGDIEVSDLSIDVAGTIEADEADDVAAAVAADEAVADDAEA
jgi:predicted TIM-barrel enzyme